MACSSLISRMPSCARNSSNEEPLLPFRFCARIYSNNLKHDVPRVTHSVKAMEGHAKAAVVEFTPATKVAGMTPEARRPLQASIANWIVESEKFDVVDTRHTREASQSILVKVNNENSTPGRTTASAAPPCGSGWSRCPPAVSTTPARSYKR